MDVVVDVLRQGLEYLLLKSYHMPALLHEHGIDFHRQET
jgi:hypothetical protein